MKLPKTSFTASSIELAAILSVIFKSVTFNIVEYWKILTNNEIIMDYFRANHASILTNLDEDIKVVKNGYI